MPRLAFESIDTDKRQRILDAVLQEFSLHPLAEAQVSRIVTAAEISRGAFYVYFRDLADAYQYVLDIALADVHGGLREAIGEDRTDSLNTMYSYTAQIVRKIAASPYRDLFEMHWRLNDSHLAYAHPDAHSTKDAATSFMADTPLMIGGVPLANCAAAEVLLDAVMQSSHECVAMVLGGQNADDALAKFKLLLDILRAGVLSIEGKHVSCA